MIFLRLLIIGMLIIGLESSRYVFAVAHQEEKEKKSTKRSHKKAAGKGQKLEVKDDSISQESKARKTLTDQTREKLRGVRKRIAQRKNEGWFDKLKQQFGFTGKVSIHKGHQEKPKIHSELKVIDLGNKIELTPEGYPTIPAIKKLIEEHLPIAGNVTVNKVGGGASTEAVYAIFNEQRKIIFFCKVSTVKTNEAHQAWENLAEIQKSRVGHFVAGLHNNQDAPIITSVEKFFRYHQSSSSWFSMAAQKKYVIEVTHAAQGKAVADFLNDSQSLEKLKNAGMAVGKALGTLHKAFIVNTHQGPNDWLTTVHGDFHLCNVFVEYLPAKPYPETKYKQKETGRQTMPMPSFSAKEMWRVYFIDNETIRHSLNTPKKIQEDLLYFIFLPMSYWGYLNPGSISDDVWNNVLTFFSAFLEGYVTVFPEERQSELATYINNLLSKCFVRAVDCCEKMGRGQAQQLQGELQREHEANITNPDPIFSQLRDLVNYIQKNNLSDSSLLPLARRLEVAKQALVLISINKKKKLRKKGKL